MSCERLLNVQQPFNLISGTRGWSEFLALWRHSVWVFGGCGPGCGINQVGQTSGQYRGAGRLSLLLLRQWMMLEHELLQPLLQHVRVDLGR